MCGEYSEQGTFYLIDIHNSDCLISISAVGNTSVGNSCKNRYQALILIYCYPCTRLVFLYNLKALNLLHFFNFKKMNKCVTNIFLNAYDRVEGGQTVGRYLKKSQVVNNFFNN